MLSSPFQYQIKSLAAIRVVYGDSNVGTGPIEIGLNKHRIARMSKAVHIASREGDAVTALIKKHKK